MSKSNDTKGYIFDIILRGDSMKKNNYLIIAIILLMALFLGYNFNNLFGSNVDWINQHIVFPDYFRMLFYKTGNLFPSLALNIGAGQNIYAFSYYGLLNPFILISYLLPFIKMVDYITLSMVLITVANGILFYKWMKNHDFNNLESLVLALVFGLATPLIFHAHRQIMFVSYMPFLIMALMGLDLYFKEHKSYLFVVSVFLMIMTSYYYSVGGLLALALYTIYKTLDNDKFVLKNFIIDILKIFGMVVIAIFMAGVFLLPTINVILSGRLDFKKTIDLITLFKPTIAMRNILYSHYDLGLTMIAPIALMYGLKYKESSKRFLVISLIILLTIPVFMFILNGGLYVRGKSLIPFLPLFVLVIGWFIKSKPRKYTVLCLTLVVNLIAYIYHYSSFIFYLDSILLVGFFFFDHLFKKKMLYVYLVFIALVSVFISNGDEDFITKNDYQKYTDNAINDVLKADHSFYRFNNLDDIFKTVNMVNGDNYYQTSLYSSTYNPSYYNFIKNVYNNTEADNNILDSSTSNNIIFETLMGVKYVKTRSNPPIGYLKVAKDVYQNNNVMPLIWASDKTLNSKSYLDLDYPYNLDVLLNYIVTDDSLNKLAVSDFTSKVVNYNLEIGSNISTSSDVVTVNTDDQIIVNFDQSFTNKVLVVSFDLLEVPSCFKGDLVIEINGIKNTLTCNSWFYSNNNKTFNYVISSNDAINRLVMSFKNGKYVFGDAHLYVLDYDKVVAATKSIDKVNIDMDNTYGDQIVGHIDVTKDGYLATTLPYDTGYTIYLNGKKTSYEKVNAGFIGLKVKKGSYDLKLVYKTPQLNNGLILSSVGFILFISLTVIQRRKHD